MTALDFPSLLDRHEADIDADIATDTQRAASRKVFVLVITEDGEPSLVQPYRTLADANAKFDSIMREEPDWDERDTNSPLLLPRTIGKAVNSVGSMMLIVERVL